MANFIPPAHIEKVSFNPNDIISTIISKIKSKRRENFQKWKKNKIKSGNWNPEKYKKLKIKQGTWIHNKSLYFKIKKLKGLIATENLKQKIISMRNKQTPNVYNHQNVLITHNSKIEKAKLEKELKKLEHQAQQDGIKREKRERVEKIWDSYGKEMSKKYKRNIGSGITTTPHNVIDIKNNIIVPEKRNIRGFVKKSGSIVQPSIATRRVNLIKPKLKMRGR